MMNKKILIWMGIVVIIALLGVYIIHVYKPSVPLEEQLKEKYSEFRIQYAEKKAQGYDVTEAKEFVKKAKQAFDRKDYRAADKLLDNAFEALEKAKIPTPLPSLENVKVVVIFEPIVGKHSIDEVADLLLKANTDFVFRAFFKMDSNWGYGKDPTLYDKLLPDAISYLKSKKPTLIVQGGISAAFLDPADTWADGTPLSEQDIEDMILHVNGQPIKRDRPWLPLEYDYVADIENEKYRDFVVGWSEKQIDVGVDSIHYDEIFKAVRYKVRDIEDYEKIRETYENVYWKDIVDRVKSYAASKNKTVYITANEGYNSAIMFHPLKYTDIVTIHFARCDKPPFKDESEQKTQFCDLEKWGITEDWDLLKEKVRESHNGKLVPIIVFIDWAGLQDYQLGLFAKMSAEKQKEFLRIIDKSTKANGILFAYPMHGGQPGFHKQGSKYKGTYNSIDYGTYDTIPELAKERASK